MGVKDYIAQYMFNVPPSISPAMDLAKMLAKIEMIEVCKIKLHGLSTSKSRTC